MTQFLLVAVSDDRHHPRTKRAITDITNGTSSVRIRSFSLRFLPWVSLAQPFFLLLLFADSQRQAKFFQTV